MSIGLESGTEIGMDKKKALVETGKETRTGIKTETNGRGKRNGNGNRSRNN